MLEAMKLFAHQKDPESKTDLCGMVYIEYDWDIGRHYYVDSTDGFRWSANPHKSLLKKENSNDQQFLHQLYKIAKDNPIMSFFAEDIGRMEAKTLAKTKAIAAVPPSFMIPELDLGRPFGLDMPSTAVDENQGTSTESGGLSNPSLRCTPDCDKPLPPSPCPLSTELFSFAVVFQQYLVGCKKYLF